MNLKRKSTKGAPYEIDMHGQSDLDTPNKQDYKGHQQGLCLLPPKPSSRGGFTHTELESKTRCYPGPQIYTFLEM